MATFESMDGIIQWKTQFIQKPTKELANKLIKCFCIDNIDTKIIISKKYINNDLLLKNVESIIPDFCLYYTPRIMNYYFYNDNINFKKCITMLKNILYHIDYLLLKVVDNCEKPKITRYKIMNKKNYLIYLKNPITIKKTSRLVDLN